MPVQYDLRRAPLLPSMGKDRRFSDAVSSHAAQYDFKRVALLPSMGTIGKLDSFIVLQTGKTNNRSG